MNTTLTLIVVLLALISGIAVGYAYASSKSRALLDSIKEECSQWRAQAHEANGRAEVLELSNHELNEALGRDAHTARLIEPIATRLADMTAKVNSLESNQSQHDAELRQQLSSFAVLNRDLLRETSSLKTALTSISARGTWGEVELRRIVEAAGMLPHVDFSVQETLAKTTEHTSTPSSSSSRPDLTVHLPGGAHIAVDAKVPLTSLLKAEATEASDPFNEKLRGELLAAHAKALKNHINELSKRDYPSEFPGSPRITVMFLPSESLLSQALAHDPTLLEYALIRGITLTTPSSFLALLRSVAVVWANSRITEEAQEILDLGKTLVSRLQIVAGHVNSLGTALKRSVTAYNKTVSSLENRLLVSVRKFDAFDSSVSSLSQLDADATQVREIVAGELTHSSSDETTYEQCLPEDRE